MIPWDRSDHTRPGSEMCRAPVLDHPVNWPSASKSSHVSRISRRFVITCITAAHCDRYAVTCVSGGRFSCVSHMGGGILARYGPQVDYWRGAAWHTGSSSPCNLTQYGIKQSRDVGKMSSLEETIRGGFIKCNFFPIVCEKDRYIGFLRDVLSLIFVLCLCDHISNKKNFRGYRYI